MAKTPKFITLHFLLLVSVVILQLSAVTSTIGIELKGGDGGNPPSNGGKWCVAKQEATTTQLQANIDWVCSQGIDCKPISLGGICFDNNNVKTRSTFIMNAYYQSKGNSDSACDFHGSGIVTTNNPSTNTCNVPNGSSYKMKGSSSRDQVHSRRSNSKWCVPKQGTSDTQLQANIDWACNPDKTIYISIVRQFTLVGIVLGRHYGRKQLIIFPMVVF
ncbi:unnamed protein product [Arabis nemorensis]|uniref:X8 domain-containing protein n=1 Tax=Arabis nemorensis TaxID=586526 RepID=A0A565BPB7_9BRAS|nr:unnamed protein product [Arabis nemorensis]